MKRTRKNLSMALAVALIFVAVNSAAAMDDCGWGRSPYGDYCDGPECGWYGARTPVRTIQEAERILRLYLSPYVVNTGKVKERGLSFEVKIFDRNGLMVDMIIIDKRTGRIRSIY